MMGRGVGPEKCPRRRKRRKTHRTMHELNLRSRSLLCAHQLFVRSGLNDDSYMLGVRARDCFVSFLLVCKKIIVCFCCFVRLLWCCDDGGKWMGRWK